MQCSHIQDRCTAENIAKDLDHHKRLDKPEDHNELTKKYLSRKYCVVDLFIVVADTSMQCRGLDQSVSRVMREKITKKKKREGERKGKGEPRRGSRKQKQRKRVEKSYPYFSALGLISTDAILQSN